MESLIIEGLVVLVFWVIGFYLLNKLVNYLVCRFTWEFKDIDMDMYGNVPEKVESGSVQAEKSSIQ